MNLYFPVFSTTVSRIVISVTVNKKLEHRYQCCSPSIGIKQDCSNRIMIIQGNLQEPKYK